MKAAKGIVVFVIASCAAFAAVAEPVFAEMPLVGTLKTKSASEISTSRWSVDVAGTDREHCDYHAIKEYLQPLGIRRLRTQAGWARCEKERGKYDFRWLDSIVFDAERRGLEVWIELSYGNPIYPNGGGRGLAGGMPSGDEALAAWDRWVGELAKRYRGKVRDWCVWNEPDLFGANGPAAQLGLALRSAEIIKREIPDARIVACALAWANPDFLKEFLPALAKSGKADLFTWVAFHHYQMNPDDAYDGEIANGVALMKKFTPHLRYWQNESGTMSERGAAGALHDHDWTEETQAKWDLRRYLADLGLDYDTAVFHICDLEYVNSGFHDGLLRYGLLRTSGQVDCFRVERVKEAYRAVQNAVSVFNDAVETVDAKNLGVSVAGLKRPALYVFRDRKTGSLLPVFWDASGVPSNGTAKVEVTLTLPGRAYERPVWVDVRTGDVHDIPAANVTAAGGKTVYSKLPCYDSPCFLAEASVLDVVASDAEKHHSTAMNERAYATETEDTGGMKVLFIGNSITLHGPLAAIGWTNNWGMAASAPEKDFVHLVTRELERRFARKADLVVRNYADFERAFRTWDWKKTEELAKIDPDVLVIALGENVPSLAKEEDRLAYRDAFKKLIGYFLDGKRTKPLSVVRGTFWSDANKDGAMAYAASDYAIPFVKADLYGKPGMDAKDSGYAHKGIQAHPGDRGMAAIAERIVEGLLPEKTDFAVTVDGRPAKVVATTLSAMEYNQVYTKYQRPAEQTERGALVQVEATGKTVWRVKVARPFKKAVVRPFSAKVKPTVQDGEVTFTLPKCGFYVLETDDYHKPLEIFVEPKNDFAEYRRTANIVFGPGLHLTRGITLKSHDRVYLDKDAVVYGGFWMDGVEDVEIRGYGTICGTTCRRGHAYDPKTTKVQPYLTPIRARRSKKITIEGPVVLDACEWCVATFGCEDVDVSHLKVTGAWRYNTDGIDFCNTRNIRMSDCYIHSFDDTIVLKGLVDFKDLPVENVKVERCVCWCGWGRTLENGLETWATKWRNVVFEDCDLIHNSMGALSVHLGGPCAVEDITFRNIRLEYDASRSAAEYQHDRDKPYAKAAERPSIDNWLSVENWKMFSPNSLYKDSRVPADEPYGTFAKVTVEDIDIQVDPGVPQPKKYVQAQRGSTFGEIKFRNVTINGKKEM